jgi:hypothetical protein
MAYTNLPVHVTEIHHFPDSRISDIFYQLAVDEALELHVAGEAQVRAAPGFLRAEFYEGVSQLQELHGNQQRSRAPRLTAVQLPLGRGPCRDQFKPVAELTRLARANFTTPPFHDRF